jgi:hypothetical protein
MKREAIAIFIVAFTGIGLTFCSEESDTKKTLLKIETSSSARAEDDSKSSGVYKGTFVGSSGSFKLIIEAGQIIGYLAVDGTEYLLTTEDISPEDLGNAITNALFTNVNQTVKLLFSVEVDGENPTATVVIDGHDDIQIVVYKETSDVLLKIFEGFQYKTYPELGVQVKAHLNIILNHDSLARVTYKTVDEVKLNNGINGTHGYESWASDAVYGPGSRVAFPDVIWIYRYYPDPNNPSGPNLVEHFFEGLSMNYSDQQIDAMRTWTEDSFTYSDSTRLKRKL